MHAVFVFVVQHICFSNISEVHAFFHVFYMNIKWRDVNPSLAAYACDFAKDNNTS